MKIAILHGPNLNMLGRREPGVYGSMTLDDINSEIKKHAVKLNVEVSFFQSNHEGEIIDSIHRSTGMDGLIINPAGYGHTSIALLDAVKAAGIPSVETHLSNIYAREEFRSHTMTSSAMIGVISGFGWHSYILALDALVGYLRDKKSE
jgi:3-dehydroquinate dehydratase II